MTKNIRRVLDFNISVSYICPATDKKIDKTLESKDIEVDFEECHIYGHYIKLYLDFKCEECKTWHEMIIQSDNPEDGARKRHEIMGGFL